MCEQSRTWCIDRYVSVYDESGSAAAVAALGKKLRRVEDGVAVWTHISFWNVIILEIQTQYRSLVFLLALTTYFIYRFPNLFLRLHPWKCQQINVVQPQSLTAETLTIRLWSTSSVQFEFWTKPCFLVPPSVLSSDHIHTISLRKLCCIYRLIWTFKYLTVNQPAPQRFHRLLHWLNKP